MKLVPLTQGKYAKVDDGDYSDLMLSKWFAVFDGYNWYAARKRNNRQERMHNYLLRPNRGFEVDHRDRDSLNNQRNNLREATHRQNSLNKRISKHNKSGFRGVSWRPKLGKWIAQARTDTTVHGVKYLGLHESAKDAALAYDRFVTEKYGEFAVTNKMLGRL